MSSPFSPHGDRTLFDLAHAALPAPAEELRRAAAQAVQDLDAHLGGHGYDLLGLPGLRAAVARRFTARGLPTTPDQILITAGGQAAIALVLATLVNPGDRVLVEHPTYPNALDAVRARGARCVPVPLEPTAAGASAWDLDLVTAAVRDAAPRLAYLVPDHQNPTGALLDSAGRERLVALARRTGTPLLIDETLAELTLTGPSPLPVAAHGAPDSALVVTVGSAAKVLWGGLRIGWIRTASPMMRRIGALRAATDLGGPVLEQLLATRLIDDLEPVVRARRAELAAARDHLLGRLGDTFPALGSVASVGRAEPVDRPRARRCPAGSSGPLAGRTCCSPRVRGSGSPARSNGTCACRTPCAATGSSRRSTGWSPRGTRSTKPTRRPSRPLSPDPRRPPCTSEP